MKPSEMTNERIAEELIATIPNLNDEAWSCTDADDILREAAARLRKSEERVSKQKSINKKLVDENEALRRLLKVVEDALKYAKGSITSDCDIECDHVQECSRDNKGCLCEQRINEALDAIRKEGGAE